MGREKIKKNRKIRQKSLRATMADIKEIESDQPDDVKEKEETKEPEEEVVDSNGKLSSKLSDISIEEIGTEESTAEKNENAEVLIPEVVQEPAPVVAVEEQTLDDEEEEDEDDDFEDETIIERLVGLTEMFPQGLTSTLSSTAFGAVSSVKWLYGASRSLTWVMSSSFAVMFFPMIIEIERLGIEEAQKQQQRQILLGPGAAMSGGAGKAQQNAPLPTVG